jgi:arylsulfatase A-like enzyme
MDRKPNIVFIFADQLAHGACGFAGDSLARTPNLDALASQGTVLTQSTSCCPLCGPYRASLFTGKHSASTGQFRNDVRVMPDPDAIGHVLHTGDYRTGYIGKWHLYCRTEDEQFTPPGPYRLGFDQYFASYNWNHDYWNGSYYLDSNKEIPMEGYQTDFQTDMALDFIKGAEDSDDPFALFISYELPHPPCTASQVPPEYYELFRDVDFSDLLYATDNVFRDFTPSFSRDWQQENVIDAHQERCRVYYAMNACLDHNVGRIVSALDQAGLGDDTIIVFTADHGDMLGGQGRVSKRIFFDKSARVPMIWRWSDHIAAGAQIDLAFNTPDIAPTMCGLMGLDAPASYEGRSFAAELCGGSPNAAAPEFAFITNMHVGKFNHDEEYRAVRSSEYLYARMVRTDKEFLYHHRSDPRELTNLVGNGDHREILERCRQALAEQMTALGDDFHTWDWYQENWIEDGHVLRSANRDGRCISE